MLPGSCKIFGSEDRHWPQVYEPHLGKIREACCMPDRCIIVVPIASLILTAYREISPAFTECMKQHAR